MTQFVEALDGTPLAFETYGDPGRPAVFLGPHFYATNLIAGVTSPWIDGLRDDFHLILADYPRGLGQTGNPVGMRQTPEFLVEEYGRIADAAGAARFGWVGYSFGGAVGVQLAARTGRVKALAVGGFPPLKAPFALMRDISRDIALNPPPGHEAMAELHWASVGFYESLIGWHEAEAIASLTMPRLVFIGTEDRAQGLPPPWDAPLAETVRRNEARLAELGWEVAWLSGADHMGAVLPDVSLGPVREFLLRSLT